MLPFDWIVADGLHANHVILMYGPDCAEDPGSARGRGDDRLKPCIKKTGTPSAAPLSS